MTQSPSDRSPAAASAKPRRAWVDPRVEKLAARETRNNIDPIVEDGAFSFGS